MHKYEMLDLTKWEILEFKYEELYRDMRSATTVVKEHAEMSGQK